LLFIICTQTKDTKEIGTKVVFTDEDVMFYWPLISQDIDNDDMSLELQSEII